MNKTNTIIFIVLLVLIIGYFVLDYVSNLGVKCENCQQYSASAEQSRAEGLFVAYYKPLTDKIKLTYHNDTIQFMSAWAEHSWFETADSFLGHKKEKVNGYNIVIEFRKYPANTYNFDFDAAESFGMGQTKKVLTAYDFSDTLILQIKERNPIDSIGWKQPLAGEKVKFVRIR